MRRLGTERTFDIGTRLRDGLAFPSLPVVILIAVLSEILTKGVVVPHSRDQLGFGSNGCGSTRFAERD